MNQKRRKDEWFRLLNQYPVQSTKSDDSWVLVKRKDDSIMVGRAVGTQKQPDIITNEEENALYWSIIEEEANNADKVTVETMEMANPVASSNYTFRMEQNLMLEGIRSILKQYHLHHLNKSHNLDMIFLSETKVNTHTVEKVFKRLKVKDWFTMPYIGRSGGFAIAWNQGVHAKLIVFKNNVFHFQVIKDNMNVFITFIYGALDNNLRDDQWNFIKSVSSVNTPWAIIGDMNFILHKDGKEGGNSPSTSSFAYMFHCIQHLRLVDLNFTGLPFTWTNKRTGNQYIQERIDRVSVNHKWLELFVKSSNKHLTRIVSDHSPILLETLPHHDKLDRTYRYMKCWVEYKDYKKVLKNSVQKTKENKSNLFKTLRNLEYDLRIWNKKDFGNIFKNISNILENIEEENKKPYSLETKSKIEQLQNELANWYEIENFFWGQHFKEKWINENDNNTNFFHQYASDRNRYNIIHTLRDSTGLWIEGQQQLSQLLTNYFKNISSTSNNNIDPIFNNILTPLIDDNDNDRLPNIPEDNEIKDALFLMNAWRAPGQDGFPSGFYQQHWDLLKDDIISWVQKVFKDKGLNGTSLRLFSKKFGLSNDLCDFLYNCISTVSSAVLVNGSPGEFFFPTRGIRQGDPMSPYIFIICMEAFSKLLSHAESTVKVTGIKVNKNCPSVSRFFFADESFLFTTASIVQAINLLDTLSIFSDSSGKIVNYQKSGIYFSKKIENKHCKLLARILKVGRITKNDTYLGTPLFFNRSKSFNYQNFLDQVYNRVQGWKAKFLSQAGRTILICSVTSAMPMYQMMCFLLPNKTLDKLNALQREFWWQKNKNNRGLHLKSWDFICTSKANGGLGIKSSHKFNLALLTRVAWRLIKNPDKLWKITVGGNGKDIEVWSDKWLPQGEIPKPKSNDFMHLISKVSDLMDDEGKWNSQLIHRVFDKDSRKKISMLDIVYDGTKKDTLIWIGTKDGSVSVKSAYNFLCDRNHVNTPVEWKRIWKLNIMPRVKIFLWKTLSECLPVRELLGRHTPIDLHCPLCNNYVIESVNHIFTKCIFSEAVWRGLSFSHHFYSAVNLSYKDWFLVWLNDRDNIDFFCLCSLVYLEVQM
ncbi:uncharacterized protein LOC113360698 [Papaver somniferum]|uniref:uncharacterized protein LOC113360698 n=1 Tax=Papaver somniferum TaxID=3469 RepID=UPI000E6FBFF7|nr:uncharacterized protein LOC113360698 [Papaver somniferum]